MKKYLEKRFVHLYSGELTSLILFIFLSFLVNRIYPHLQIYSLYSFWMSFIFLEILLLQGTIYWYAKYKRLKTEKTSVTPISIVKILYHAKKINIIIMLVSLVMFIFDYIKWSDTLPIGGFLIALFIYLFAIIEFINYFYIQLSHDNASDIRSLLKNKKFKKSSLNKDFKRIKKN